MTFLLSIQLVLAAFVLAIIGLVSDAYWAFAGAAGCSAVSIIVLWRRVVGEREQVSAPDPVDVREADWNRPLTRREGEDDAPLPTDLDLGIEQYGDLVAAEVLPCLETLSIEQLRAVIERERRGLAREAIIRRAGRLIGLTTGEIKLDLRLDSIEHAGMRDAMRKEQSMEKNGPDLTL